MEKFLNEFKNPGSEYRGAPFWAWNGKLKPEELRRQIRIMKEMGLGGFFMHSRVGLDTPYLSKEWFECINACADEGKKQSMLAFLYDEDRWPSGAAGGLVTKDKKYRMRHLVMRIFNEPKKMKDIANVVGIFLAEFEGNIIKKYRRLKKDEKIKKLSENEKILVFTKEFAKESDWYNGYTYLDTMDPEAVKQFIKITHENYKKYCGKYFEKVIPGIFTDEPNYGNVYFHYEGASSDEGNIAIPWTDKLAKTFKERYGYDILDHLPEIYFEIEGQKISKVRHNYFDCITYLFVNSFAKQIGNWCEKNKLLFTGHILEEDTLLRQAHVVGNCLRFYEYMQAPGMDLLTEHWRIFNTAKQVSSVARQFGRKWRLTETYGCTGWDFSFEGHKALGDWQVALGINLRCQHLSWYTMLGEAKRDYPASIFYQSPWWNVYKYVEDYFARIHLVMTQGEEIRDLLVIHPIESMWTVYKM
ncbi:MAG TPA: glycosyl hydrolase, partial [bacterium]|nr:glycosyl hydrolase [bacterium]